MVEFIQKIDLLDKNPTTIFRKWYENAAENPSVVDANLFSFATCSKDGRPSVRSLLLRGMSDEGLKIFTDYNSAKGKDLAENPICSLVFCWLNKESDSYSSKQVIINGRVEKLSRSECNEYYESVPLSYKVRAHFHQDEVANDPSDIIRRSEELLEQFRENGELGVPDYWGGYLIIPDEFTFYSGSSNGINQRVHFIRRGQVANDGRSYHQGTDEWLYQFLYP